MREFLVDFLDWSFLLTVCHVLDGVIFHEGWNDRWVIHGGLVASLRGDF